MHPASLPAHWNSDYSVGLLYYLTTDSLQGLQRMSHRSHTHKTYDSSSVSDIYKPSVNILLKINQSVSYLLFFIFDLFSHLIQLVFNHIDKELVVDVVIAETEYFSIFSSFRFLNAAEMIL